MLSVNGIIQIALPILYGSLVVCGLLAFFKNAVTEKILYRLTIAVALIHVAYIGSYTVQTGHCLLTTASEIFSLISFTMMTTYIIVELRPVGSKAGTGLMVMLVAFVFQLFSSLVTKGVNVASINPIFLDPAFNVHVATIVFGYAALTLSTIYGSLYLLLYRAMKRNQFGAVFQQLPSLSRLEKYGIRTLAAGFVFLSISIAFGLILIRRSFSPEEAQSYLTDPKTIATILIWFVFGATLLVRKLMHVEGRKIVVLWMAGYALTLVSSTIINAFGTEYHHFL
ncbi:MAG: cytochrome c biogenesis protein CcsA [Bacteroidetes bacterium]|nr:cytochrome c biogenesis protein CcsA [Bacteroidota bacterium]